MQKHVARFRRIKFTKNATRYQEIEVAGAPMVIDALYVKKWFTGEDEDADLIQVTIEPFKETETNE